MATSAETLRRLQAEIDTLKRDREALNRVTPTALLALQQQFAARFPESTLPFLDKGTQSDQPFCGIMAALLYEE
jgi:hypothetical protein